MGYKTDLLEGSIIKVFLKYISTGIGGMAMVSLYILFDTIFIGQGIGREGLAALNIALPMYNLLFGTGMLIGTGSATAMSIYAGSGKIDRAKSFFNHGIILGLIMGLLYAALGSIYLESISVFLGASEESLPLVKEYMGIILPFSWSFLMVYNLAAIVRNDNAPRLAMIAMGAGGACNIILDYIFIFPMDMGMGGAANATVISSLVSLAVLLWHFLGGRSSYKFTSLRLGFHKVKRIMSIGAGSFIVEISSGIIIFLFNQELLKLIGDIGVSAYSIIANVALICVAVFTGVAQGMQPIISINFGAGKLSRVYKARKLGLGSALFIGLVFTVLGLAVPWGIVSVFTRETGEIVDITVKGIRLYFLAFPIMGINIVMSAYFQSLAMARYSTLISVSRGIFFTIAGLKLLSLIFGVTGIWLTIPLAEVLTLIIIVIILMVSRKAAGTAEK